MENSILNFAKQFAFRPEIINSEKLKNKVFKNFILGGMGGSHLSAGILHAHDPSINLYIHRDYGLPPYEEEFCQNSLFIASSYSGNTEEIVDFADEAYSKGYDLIIITTGGKLLDFAKINSLPYIKLPDDGIQPRIALGYSTIAVASIVSPSVLPELVSMEQLIKPLEIKDKGFELAKNLNNKIPIIYSVKENRSISYIWKIKINETGKIPSFYNIIPELNHNEMQGYDFVDANIKLSENFHFIFIQDDSDNERNLKRMSVLENQLQEKGLSVTRLFLEGSNRFEKIFKSIILADWTSFFISEFYKTEPEQVPLIEDFKKRLLS